MGNPLEFLNRHVINRVIESFESMNDPHDVKRKLHEQLLEKILKFG